MYSLIYVSTATEPMSGEDLRQLLEKSRINNLRRGITGMLVYKDGNFMQAIEGDEEEIRTLHRIIRADPRHHGLVTLVEGQIEARSFADWSMGFRDLRDPDVLAITGFSEFLNTPLTGQEFAEKPSLAQKLLLSFKRTM